MKTAVSQTSVMTACLQDGRFEKLHEMASSLEECQKSLNEYLDMKKKIFPRFYFVSNVALLDILSNGNNPPAIMRHFGDCYIGLDRLTFTEGSNGTVTNSMVAKDGETVEFNVPFRITGAVEAWLNAFTLHMKSELRHSLNMAMQDAAQWSTEKPRDKWLYNYPAQVTVAACQIYWTEEGESALEDFENGNPDAVKQYLQVCNKRLESLIKLVQGKLGRGDRKKIITLITMDVHARDIIQRLVDERVKGPMSFAWQQQMRLYWDPSTKDISCRVVDFSTLYSYEAIGNTGRLVITPLTDRCYITLCTALRLMLSGAPAGPAGTGKTETVKDLSRCLGLPVYVFNCSDQMTYKSLADTFKGLAQSGAWGCFDEFNRIALEVLSIVATQVQTLQEAIQLLALPSNRPEEYQDAPPGCPPCRVGNFEFQGDVISLVPTVGIWITMNPGYAGRNELGKFEGSI